MMVEKYKIRTDLAMEQKERFESDHVEAVSYTHLQRNWILSEKKQV